jgi:hypothetical protein
VQTLAKWLLAAPDADWTDWESLRSSRSAFIRSPMRSVAIVIIPETGAAKERILADACARALLRLRAEASGTDQ